MAGISNVYAAPIVKIDTDKNTYSYGDFLSFTVQVSEITGELATLHIIDESGKSSSAIPISITESKTVVPSPYPFELTVYPQGRYILNIEYSGSSDSAEFELIDSGKIMIPFWVRDFSKYWYNDEISDNEFAKAIEFLVKENIIVVPQSTSQGTGEEVKIPNWIKTNTGWWVQGKISDMEFAKSIEYLIKIGIIIL
ncbi:MAG: hypothetical protein ACREAL_06845 [Nitrosopumilaceae archaeon]